MYRAAAAPFISLLVLAAALLPAQSRAGVLSNFLSFFSTTASAQANPHDQPEDLQAFPLPQPAMNINPAPAQGGGDVTIIDGSAVLPQEGPSGTIADIVKPAKSTVFTYIVQPGDTVATVAAANGVSESTILSFNDLKKGAALTPGQELVIMPVDEIRYVIQRGDTLSSIAKATGGDANEIAVTNGIEDGKLIAGQTIIIPNGEVPASAKVTTKAAPSSTKSSTGTTKPRGITGTASIFANNPAEPAHNIGDTGTLAETSYYIAPLSHYVRTQGIHGYNAVDLAAPKGTPIVAAAAGSVVVAREGGWNGGYGSYVVISHDNGSQTLYAHMSKVDAYDGETVAQGQVIGYVGCTGECTGPHVHFEIRNGIRNPF